MTARLACRLLISLLPLLPLILPAGAIAVPVADYRTPDLLVSFAPIDSLPLPPGRVTGMAWVGPDTLALLVQVPGDQPEAKPSQVFLIYQSRRGEILQRLDFTGMLLRGLAYDGTFLWSCGEDENGGGVVFEIDPGTGKADRSFPTPGHAPSGICWDGTYIWITDRDSRHIDRLDIDSGKVLRSILAPAFSPYGLAYDGQNMWVTDSGTGRLYRLSGMRRRWSATVDLQSFLLRGRDVLLLHDGTSLWYLPVGDPQAVRVAFF
jgi:outer membrane protein assembly factor BamB